MIALAYEIFWPHIYTLGGCWETMSNFIYTVSVEEEYGKHSETCTVYDGKGYHKKRNKQTTTTKKALFWDLDVFLNEQQSFTGTYEAEVQGKEPLPARKGVGEFISAFLNISVDPQAAQLLGEKKIKQENSFFSLVNPSQIQPMNVNLSSTLRTWIISHGSLIDKVKC